MCDQQQLAQLKVCTHEWMTSYLNMSSTSSAWECCNMQKFHHDHFCWHLYTWPWSSWMFVEGCNEQIKWLLWFIPGINSFIGKIRAQLQLGFHHIMQCIYIAWKTGFGVWTGLGSLNKYFYLLFYSFILNALAYYSFTVTYYSHLCLQKKWRMWSKQHK